MKSNKLLILLYVAALAAWGCKKDEDDSSDDSSSESSGAVTGGGGQPTGSDGDDSDDTAPIITLNDAITNAAIELDADATDESEMTYSWEVISGGVVTFDDATLLRPTATAMGEGQFVLRLTATDESGNASSAEMNLIWDVTPPYVDAGLDQTSGGDITTAANVTDNLGDVTLIWTQLDGSGVITFDDDTVLETSLSADADDTYTIQLEATDEAGNVASATFVYVKDSAAPIVDAGIDLVANAEISIDATVTNTLTPTYAWTKISGPGTITFDPDNTEDTDIVATADGIYVLQLAVFNTGPTATSTDQMQLIWDTTPPLANAGTNRYITGNDLETSSTIDLNGSGYDLTDITYLWTKQSGPGTASFGDDSVPATTFSADADGMYVLELTTTDALGHVSSDTVNIDWQSALFVKEWDFSDNADYTFSASDIILQDGLAQLLATVLVTPDDDQTDFDAGTHSDTEYSSGVQLSAGGLTAQSGSYTSRIQDAGSTVNLKQIEWTFPSDSPSMANLPDNKGTGDWFDTTINMSTNVFLMHFDDGGGTTKWKNSSGETYSITCTDCSDAQQPGAIGNGSAKFDGSATEFLTVSDDPSLRVTGNVTFAAWVRLESDANGWAHYILEKGQDDVADSYGWLLYKTGGVYKPIFEFNDKWTTAYRYFQATYSVSLGTWHHMAFVFDDTANEVREYLDGALMSTTSIAAAVSINPNFNSDLLIGKQNYLTNHASWDGDLDEIGIFNHAMVDAEITELYKRGAVRMGLQVRACTASDCSDDPDFVGPDGTNATSFDGRHGIAAIPGVSGQYLQYKTDFVTPDNANSAVLESVKLQTVPETNPTIEVASGRPFDTISTFEHQTDPSHVGTVRYVLSNDGTNWYYHNGAAWVASSGYAEANAYADVNANINSFASDVAGGDFYFKAYFSAENDTGLIRLDNISISGTKN